MVQCISHKMSISALRAWRYHLPAQELKDGSVCLKDQILLFPYVYDIVTRLLEVLHPSLVANVLAVTL